MGVSFTRDVINPILMSIGVEDIRARQVNLGEGAYTERRKELILIQKITQNATKPFFCRYSEKPMNMTVLVVNGN